MAATREQQLRNIALRRAYDIEDKKRLQTQITDLVIECFDLPSQKVIKESPSDLTPPAQSDVSTFKRALTLFQPSDFDDLVYERNIDHRCGYALCSRPNKQLGSAVKVWNGRYGSDFELVRREELERWCSGVCARKAAFVTKQLSTEPAWVRSEPYPVVKLLEESEKLDTDVDQTVELEANMTERMRRLALERGDLGIDEWTKVIVSEKADRISPSSVPPSLSQESIEGYQTRRVHFASLLAPRKGGEV